MFERVVVTASDVAASRRFYATVLGALGVEDWREFELVAGDEPTTGLHLGFSAASRAHVDAFWRAGVEAGYTSDGEPGPRPVYAPGYYGGFLLDPAGLSAEAVHHERVRNDGTVDHLWLGVSDRDAAAAFYRSLPGIAESAAVEGERHHFRNSSPNGGTFGVVADGRPPTRGLAMTLIGDEPLTAHDPDGNRVEVVRRAEFGVPGPLRDTLVAAVLRGEKTASTSLLAEWEALDAPLPEVGERQTVVDSDEARVGAIEVTAVETIRLGDADDALARDEGEGFADAAAWRAAHLEFWERYLRLEFPEAFPIGDDTPIVVERFRVVAS